MATRCTRCRPGKVNRTLYSMANGPLLMPTIGDLSRKFGNLYSLEHGGIKMYGDLW
ncbi:hypothetical protein CLU79DRAFT_780340 [Phycomyces nitens]|nr:hypothetical protein CLU79DRAFT_780340 [Phycomyces nitens]